MICRGVRRGRTATQKGSNRPWRLRRLRTEARNPRRSEPLGLTEADRIQKPLIAILKEQEARKWSPICAASRVVQGLASLR